MLSRDVLDADAGDHDVRHGQTQNEREARAGAWCAERVRPPSHPGRMVSSAGNVMCRLATQHVPGLLRIYIVVVCQALLRMCPKAKAGRRGSAVAQPKEHLD